MKFLKFIKNTLDCYTLFKEVKMNKCKLVLFDMDGVTLDSEPLYAAGENKLFKEYGVTIPDEDWRLFRGCTEEEFYTLSMSRYKIKENRKVFQTKGRQYVREEFKKNVSFMSGFKELVTFLKDNNHKIGLVTASPEYMFNWLNSKLKLTTIFEHVVFREMTLKSKPSPEPYLLAMSLFNISPKETMIIEDSVHGIKAGISSGAIVVALTGSVNPEDMPRADRIINNLREIDNSFIGSLF